MRKVKLTPESLSVVSFDASVPMFGGPTEVGLCQPETWDNATCDCTHPPCHL